jgi:hypothetical protein
MTSRRMPRAGVVPARPVNFAKSCMVTCVDGNGSPRSWSASSITQRPGMPPPHESHHLPAAVIAPLLGSRYGFLHRLTAR